MKQINVFFEDKIYMIIKKVKDQHGGSWHDFLLDLARFYEKEVLNG